MGDNQNNSAGAARIESRPEAKTVNTGRVDQPGETRLVDHREALREAIESAGGKD